MQQSRQHHAPHVSHAVAVASAALACTLALTACSPESSDEAPTPSSAATPTSAAEVASSERPEGDAGASISAVPETQPETQAETPAQKLSAASDDGQFSTEQVRVTQPQPADLQLQDVRAGSHGDIDRVVFEYAGMGMPSYVAGYVDTPRQQASGNVMEVPGAAHLEVNVQGTAGDMMRTDAPITAMGSKGVAAGNIADVYLGSIFEADSQFFIGLDSQRGYKIYTLENPTRIVVDIAR
ncbi:MULTISPECIES: AMIN-like domain-containing (lipo)protein [Corynebacterium]|uniref:AMIN-like domain-containing protein n=1 Tax=Corynebacterium hadale TaxID=2026255 RepID=A0A269PDB4_9CORY|nr:hypothetical protein [Corynebacterium hadale]PAJ69632.1 hypothetical protein CIG21_06885 [Corynebacterium hadale]WKC60343.1 hypothetical protein CHAD_07380 [Corynebacterium hadale]